MARIRAKAPEAGIRSNFIVIPGETDEDFAELVAFLEQARLMPSDLRLPDEDGTEAAGSMANPEETIRSGWISPTSSPRS